MSNPIKKEYDKLSTTKDINERENIVHLFETKVVFDFEEIHADHIKAWSKGGHTTPENCQMLCRDCNLKKGNQ